MSNTPEEILRTVHLGNLTDSDLVRKSCYVNTRTDESVLFGLHVPGEEYLAVLVVVKAAAVVESIRTAERSRIAVHEYAKTCEILGLVFKNCFLGNCFCDFFNNGRVAVCDAGDVNRIDDFVLVGINEFIA